MLLVEDAGPALNETYRGYAERINKAAQFMDNLLRDLVEFNRLAQQEIELVPVSLEAVVQSVRLNLEKEIEEKNARVETAGPWPSVLAHAPTLVQVLLNLVSNALKFVRPEVPPVIRLRAEIKENSSAVWVEDNGIGISPGSSRAKFFGLFKSLHGKKYPGHRHRPGHCPERRRTHGRTGRRGRHSRPRHPILV